jgi:tetratricopeptide (TPR) repeat protein
MDNERVAILSMAAQAYSRLGDRQAMDRLAWECVQMAERVGDPTLLAQSLNRLGVSFQYDHPDQAIEIFRRSLALYEDIGDRRGQALCHNNIGIILSNAGRWVDAQREFTTASQLGRAAGAPDVWGLAALNLGVAFLKSGDYDRARDLFGEALALFAAVKNSEPQLIALYNLAHLDRERGEFTSAAELYDVSCSLAQRIGQSDIEIGAMAGAALSLLAQGKLDEARSAHRAAEERMSARPDWFQGRELVEVLRIRLAVGDGQVNDAIQRFEQALALAEVVSDRYGAAWITAQCADVLLEHDPERVRSCVQQYAGWVKEYGYNEMSRRYDDLLARA